MAMRLTITLLALLFATPAGAQSLADGRVRGFFFRANGLPVVDVRVVLGGATIAKTDDEGMFLVDLPAGAHSLTFHLPGRGVLEPDEPVVVLEGQETEFLVTLTTEGAPVVDVEIPKAAIVEQRDVAVATGTVSGTIISGAKETPVADARVFVRGTRADARTDANGRYRLQLPIGEQELTVIHPSFTTQTLRGVDVNVDAPRTLDIVLEPKTLRHAQMVFTAPRIVGSTIDVLRERQESSNVADVLGADQISKSGDSDAASALSRVTGITVIGGRFVYVRGLGERYSSTLLDNSSLPSPDPERRVVPLDLFPASAISGLVVQKSYSADIPGEFGGGIVKIRTKEIPEEFTIGLGVSGQYNSTASFSDGLVYGGGGSDFLGFGVGARSLPNELAQVTSERTLRPYVPIIAEDGFTADERERFAEMLDPNFGTTTSRLAPDLGLNGEIGGKFDAFGAKAGAYLSTNFSNVWSIKDSEFRTTAVNSESQTLRVQKNQRILDVENEVALSAIGAAGLDLDDDNQVRVSIGVFRISSNVASETSGFDDDRGAEVLKSRLIWSERMVNTNQIRGTNVVSEDLGLKLDWRYQFSIATRNQPDRRSIRYTEISGQFLVDPDGTERFFSELVDLNHDIGADVSMPLKLLGREMTVKFGTAVELKDRDVDARRFFYKRNTNRDPEESSAVRALPRDRLFAPDTIEPGLHELEESTRSDDNYAASQRLFAAYALADLGVVEDVSVQIGVRAEQSSQTIEVLPLPGVTAATIDPASLSVFDVLPAVTATWSLMDDLQLRFGAARTVNRPSFRELSSAAYIDLARAREFRGNPELQRADLLHGDVRLEWYPAPGESVSIAAFGKRINAPIENSISGGATLVSRPVNTESAQNFGLELEARKNLGFVLPMLEDAYVAGNFTFVDSKITIGEDKRGVLTSTERALQGQSPYVLNAQVGYDNVDWGTSVAVLFNVFGRRINDVGAEGLPDIFEEPRPELNLVVKQAVGRFRFSLKVRNILNTDYQLTQTEPREGGEAVVLERYKRGVAMSLGVSADLD